MPGTWNQLVTQFTTVTPVDAANANGPHNQLMNNFLALRGWSFVMRDATGTMTNATLLSAVGTSILPGVANVHRLGQRGTSWRQIWTGTICFGTLSAQTKAVIRGAEHAVATTNVHGLTFTAEGAGGGLDSDTVDAVHALSMVQTRGDWAAQGTLTIAQFGTHLLPKTHNWYSSGRKGTSWKEIYAGTIGYGTLTVSTQRIARAWEHSQATTNVHGLTFTAEGAGGGLDADTVDTIHAASIIQTRGDWIAAGTLTIGQMGTHLLPKTHNWYSSGRKGTSWKEVYAGTLAYGTLSASTKNLIRGYEHSVATANVHGLTFTAEGAGGGLDADTVDGIQAASMAQTRGNWTLAGTQTITGGVKYGTGAIPIGNFRWLTSASNLLAVTNQADTAWTDLDITTSTSANAYAAFIWFNFGDNNGACTLRLRKKGEFGTTQYQIFYTSAAGLINTYPTIIGLDSSQTFQYHLDAFGTRYGMYFTVKAMGYFETVV